MQLNDSFALLHLCQSVDEVFRQSFDVKIVTFFGLCQYTLPACIFRNYSLTLPRKSVICKSEYEENSSFVIYRVVFCHVV